MTTSFEIISNLPQNVLICQYIIHKNGVFNLLTVANPQLLSNEFDKNSIKSFADLISGKIHPDDIAKLSAAYNESNVTGKPFDLNLRILNKENNYEWMRLISRPQLLKNGDIFRSCFLIENNEAEAYKLKEKLLIDTLSEQNEKLEKANIKILKSRENYRKIMDAIPKPIFLKCANGQFVYVNTEFCKFHGKSDINDFLELSCYDLLPKKFHSQVRQQDQKTLESGNPTWSYNFEFSDHTNKIRYFDIVKSLYQEANEDQPLILAVMIETTQKREAEIERQVYIDDLLRQNRDLEQFSYIVSHNLRGSVANIIGIARYLQIQDAFNQPESHTMRRMIDGLGISATKLDSVIKDLDLVLRSQKDLPYEDVAINTLYLDIKFEFQELLKMDEFQFKKDFSDVVYVRSIKSYLHSILHNLISNSIKFRKQTGVCVIEVTAKQDDTCVTITVKDNGIGLDLEKNKNELFGFYKRFHSHVPGKGLAMFMIKSQLEILGGTYRLDSNVGIGTTFSFTLYKNTTN